MHRFDTRRVVSCGLLPFLWFTAIARGEPRSATTRPTPRCILYISQTGDDHNSGADPAHPVRSVAALNALGSAGPGSRIFFKAAETFAGPVRLTVAGTADQPCVIGSYGIGKAVLTDAGAPDRPILQLVDSEYVTVEQLRFVGTPGSHYPGPDFMPVNHTHALSITSARASGRQMRDVSVMNCAFQNTQTGVWIDCMTQPGLDGFDHVRLTDNIFDGVYQFGCFVIGCDQLNAGRVDQFHDVLIRGNRFSHIRGDPHIASEAQPLGVACATDVVIEQNQFDDNCGFGGGIAGTPVGGSTALSVSNCRRFRISHNVVTGTHCVRRFDGSAIDVDQDSSDGEINANLTYDNDGPAVQLGSFGGLVSSNIFIHHNISFNDVRGSQPDSVQGAIRFWGHTTNTLIANNTIFVDRAGSRGTPSCINFEDAGNVGVTIVNNVLKTTGGIPMIRPNGSAAGDYSPAHLDGSDHARGNCYDATGGPLLICTDDLHGHYAPVTTADQWRSLGQETLDGKPTGVFADAGLRITATTELHLPTDLSQAAAMIAATLQPLPGSPCLGKGVLLPARGMALAESERTDFDGRPTTPTTIGAIGP